MGTATISTIIGLFEKPLLLSRSSLLPANSPVCNLHLSEDDGRLLQVQELSSGEPSGELSINYLAMSSFRRCGATGFKFVFHSFSNDEKNAGALPSSVSVQHAAAGAHLKIASSSAMIVCQG